MYRCYVIEIDDVVCVCDVEMLDVMEGGFKLCCWYGFDSFVGDGIGVLGDENGDEIAAYGDVDEVDEDDDDVELNLFKMSILVMNVDGVFGEFIVV